MRNLRKSQKQRRVRLHLPEEVLARMAEPFEISAGSTFYWKRKHLISTIKRSTSNTSFQVETKVRRRQAKHRGPPPGRCASAAGLFSLLAGARRAFLSFLKLFLIVAFLII